MIKPLPAAPESRPMKALVIAREDWGKRISKVLERQDIACRLYTSLPRMSDKIRRNAVDLVLADIGMPGLSGGAAIRELKKVRLDDIPLVLLTTAALAAVGEFLEPGVFFCSFDDLKRGDLSKRIGKSKLSASGSPGTNVPLTRPLLDVHDPETGRLARRVLPPPLAPDALARHVLLDLHDPETGRLDARRIAAYLHISLTSLAAVTGGSVAGIHKAPGADSFQQALAPIARTISVLSEVLQSKERVQAWLHSPHPDLDRRIPMRLILEGHAGAVADMLEAALAGQPS